MDNNYSKRGFLLPKGYKELVDSIEGGESEPAGDFEVTVQLPGLRPGDIEIVVEGRKMRIVGNLSGTETSFESEFEVPPGYRLSFAKAIYIKDMLHISIPRD